MSALEGRPVTIYLVTKETINCRLIRVLSAERQTEGILHVRLDDTPVITNLYERHIVFLTYADGKPGNYYLGDGDMG